MLLTNSCSLIFKYRYGMYDSLLHKCNLKKGKWFINYNNDTIVFRNNNEFRIKNSYTRSLIPSNLVKQLNSQIISNNKLVIDFNMVHFNYSEYSLLMHYCDEDLLSCFTLSRKRNEVYQEVNKENDFILSF